LVSSLALAAAACVALLACGSSADFPPASNTIQALTWYRDIEPIAQEKCGACHVAGGMAPVVFDETTVQALAKTIVAKVRDRAMPPWPPGPLSKPLVGERALTDAEIDRITRWAEAGAPLGDRADHQQRASVASFDPGGPPDIRATMSASGVRYVPPENAKGTDEVRCFVVDLANAENLWLRAVRWVAGTPAGIHHIGGAVLTFEQASAARALSGKDGRPGYECAGGLRVPATSGLSASGAGADTGTLLPKDGGIFVPARASVVLSVHYVTANVKAARVPDDSGIELWISRDGDHRRPMLGFEVHAPSEMPCPSGVSSDPNDKCSRAYALSHVEGTPAKEAAATNDFLLRKCKTTLDEHYAKLSFARDGADASRFAITTSCEDALPYDGLVQVVHAHMHTRGASARIEAQKADGSWEILLDIPKYRWVWEGAYLMKEGFPVAAGRRVRMTCVYDNGTANQWSAVTGEPGHDGPAQAPLETPHYVVAGPNRGDDMCSAMITVQRAPYKNASYASACAEAQAIYAGTCTDGAVSFTSGACTGALETGAVRLLGTPPEIVKQFWCSPKDAGANAGAACERVLTCSLACDAREAAAPGVSTACATACKADVNAYGPTAGQPAEAASRAAAWQFDVWHECAERACGDRADYKSYVDCASAECTSLTRGCGAT
jgi:hypothetical protein